MVCTLSQAVHASFYDLRISTKAIAKSDTANLLKTKSILFSL